MVRRPIALAVFWALAGCGGGAKHQAASLVAAVDQYRRAADASKGAQVALVSRVECSEASVCDAKRACLDAIEPTAQALALKEQVAARLADIEQHRLAPDAPEAQALPGMLDEAARLLGKGRAQMSDCERKLTDLRAAYGV